MLLDYGAFEDDTPVFNHPLQVVERARSKLRANGTTNDPFLYTKSDTKPEKSSFELVGAETPKKDSSSSNNTGIKNAIADARAIKFAENEDLARLNPITIKTAPKKINFSRKKPEQTSSISNDWLAENKGWSEASVNSTGQPPIYPWFTEKEREAADLGQRREAKKVAEDYLKANCPMVPNRLDSANKTISPINVFPGGTTSAQAVSDATLTDLKELMSPPLPAPDMSHKEAIKAANDEYQQQMDKYEETKASVREMTEKIDQENEKILAGIRKVSERNRMDQAQILEGTAADPSVRDFLISKAKADEARALQRLDTPVPVGLHKREPVNYCVFPPELDTASLQKTKTEVDALWADAVEANSKKNQTESKATNLPFDPYKLLLPENEWGDRLAGLQKPKTGMAANIGKHREDKAGHVLGMRRLSDYDVSREKYNARGGELENLLLEQLEAKIDGMNDRNVQYTADMKAAKKAKKTLGIDESEPTIASMKPKQPKTDTCALDFSKRLNQGESAPEEMSALHKSLADIQARLDTLVTTKKKKPEKYVWKGKNGLTVVREPSPTPSNPFDDCNATSDEEYCMVEVEEEKDA